MINNEGIISRDHVIEYIQLVSRMEKSDKLLKIIYNNDPSLWVRNMIFFNPHFLNHLVTYWLIDLPRKEILEDFKKCLKYCVFSALSNIVGKKLYPYTDGNLYGNIYGWDVDNFTCQDGFDLYTRLIFFGLEKYKIEEEKYLLLNRDCKDFIVKVNNYQGVIFSYRDKLYKIN